MWKMFENWEIWGGNHDLDNQNYTHFFYLKFDCPIFIILVYIMKRKLKQWSTIPDISKYAGPSDMTGKNQTGPTMFSAYRSECPVKIYSILRSGNNFLFIGPSNSVFKSRSFLQ